MFAYRHFYVKNVHKTISKSSYFVRWNGEMDKQHLTCYKTKPASGLELWFLQGMIGSDSRLDAFVAPHSLIAAASCLNWNHGYLQPECSWLWSLQEHEKRQTPHHSLCVDDYQVLSLALFSDVLLSLLVNRESSWSFTTRHEWSSVHAAFMSRRKCDRSTR